VGGFIVDDFTSCQAPGVRRSMSFDVLAIQKDLKAARLDGWLFYDFRGRDPIAHRILELPPGMRTRRWFYFVPTKGAPRKLVHKIESESLAALPGETLYYADQSELHENLSELLGNAQSIAMQYSPRNAIPYVSMVDAGTVELGAQRGAEDIYIRRSSAEVRGVLDCRAVAIAPRSR